MNDMFTKDIEEVTLNPVEMKDEELISIHDDKKTKDSKLSNFIKITNRGYQSNDPSCLVSAMSLVSEILKGSQISSIAQKEIAGYCPTSLEEAGYTGTKQQNDELSKIANDLKETAIEADLSQTARYDQQTINVALQKTR